MTEKSKTIEVKYLARVEGEGGLRVTFEGDKVAEVQLNIFEPPRFFEAFLRGKHFSEAPDVTSRICGICPIAYQTSALNAMEDVCRVKVHDVVQELRRMIYLGEWIESHTLHIYMLHAPDFLGFEGGVEMAKKYPQEVKRGLELKRLGNEVMSFLGGREIHPVNLRVGGFYRLPSKDEMKKFLVGFEKARKLAEETVRWTSGFKFPEANSTPLYVSLRAEKGRYPVEEGRVLTGEGDDYLASDYEKHFTELHVAHSNALHSVYQEKRRYVVGPMARYHLNFDRLSPAVKAFAAKYSLTPPVVNPFRVIQVRSLEVLYACEEISRIGNWYLDQSPIASAGEIAPRAGTGYGVSEAPRGLLYHRYEIDKDGTITLAKIVPPTSQNQLSIEADVRSVIEGHRKMAKPQLTLLCEQTIRNYDPCISCATHFLKVEWNER